jgi:hypothetical protein
LAGLNPHQFVLRQTADTFLDSNSNQSLVNLPHRKDALNGIALAGAIDGAQAFGLKSTRTLLPHEFPQRREHI